MCHNFLTSLYGGPRRGSLGSLRARGRQLFDVVLLVTVHLADVLENANEDILTAMRVAAARILEHKPSGGSHTFISIPSLTRKSYYL